MELQKMARSSFDQKKSAIMNEGSESFIRNGFQESTRRNKEMRQTSDNYEDVEDSLPDGACFSRISSESSGARTSARDSKKKTRNSVLSGGGESVPARRRCSTLKVPINNLDGSMGINSIPAQYLGTFPLHAEDQAQRADIVRTRLRSFEDEDASSSMQRSVSLIISLGGVKIVSSSDPQTIFSSHALRRISYATCEPNVRLVAFLAREPQSPLYIQLCHVFRTDSPEQAEEANALIGNAFRLAYSLQIHAAQEYPGISALPLVDNLRRAQSSAKSGGSRSVESLLSPPTPNEDEDEPDLDLIEGYEDFRQFHRQSTPLDEPVYETTFRNSVEIHYGGRSSNGLCNEDSNVRLPSAHFQHQSPHANNNFINNRANVITVVPENISRRHNPPPSQQHPPYRNNPHKQGFYKKSKPNSLPVLNCLFAALQSSNKDDNRRCKDDSNGNIEDDEEDLTPYEVPAGLIRSYRCAGRGNKICSSYTHEDITRLNRRPGNSQTSTPPSQKSTSYVNETDSNSSSFGRSSESVLMSGIGKSKSAHIITSCEVYSEVLDTHNGKSSNSNPYRTLYQNVANNSYWHPAGGRNGNSSSTSSSTGSGVTPPPLYPGDAAFALSYPITDDPELKTAPWYQPGIHRDKALEMLGHDEEGAFVVRDSRSHSGGLALTIRVPFHFQNTGFAHYLIVRAPKGFRIKGSPKQFSTLTSLLVHHSVMPEMLPCPLSLNKYSKLFRPFSSSNPKYSDDDDDDEDEDHHEDETDLYLDPDKDYALLTSLRKELLMSSETDRKVEWNRK